jgi:hypothetical protein
MQIESTTFGSIPLTEKTMSTTSCFSGEAVKRKKKLSKKLYGTSNTLSKDEAKFVFEKGCQQLIVGSGQHGIVHLSPEPANLRSRGSTASISRGKTNRSTRE